MKEEATKIKEIHAELAGGEQRGSRWNSAQEDTPD